MNLDNDFYNFTMGQIIWKNYYGVEVEYKFKNRTSDIPLGHLANDIEMDLEEIRDQKLSLKELAYLESLEIFDRDYLLWLANAKLPPVEVVNHDGELIIEFTGNWAEAIFWETPILYTVNRCYAESVEGFLSYDPRIVGASRLDQKMKWLKEHPYIKFFEFGTRRRYSLSFHEFVTEIMLEEIPRSFLGTSNVSLAMNYDIPVRGTMAHQLYMVLAALRSEENLEGFDLRNPLKASQKEVENLWYNEYGKVWNGHLLIALPDTFGSRFYFDNWTEHQAELWHGVRQDSGDPFQFGEMLLALYQQWGIDSRTKLLGFSDGLNLPTMDALHQQFATRADLVFGWGTNLTNDTGIPNVSIVVKPTRANGIECVKLSDNLAKSIGSPEGIEKYKQLANYKETYLQQPTY